MLMTLYYNIFGPEIYYKLFSLGALGEGDKDTFAAAALACGEKYYQVASSIRTLGYLTLLLVVDSMEWPWHKILN